MQTHPKWKFHATEQAVMVDDERAEEALGEGWFDTPAEAADHASTNAGGEGDDDKITEDERLILLELARSMDLKPHHRLSGEKLLAMIQEERDRLKAAEQTE